MRWTVIVTYGNSQPNARFASDLDSRETAEAMQKLAIEKGYRDATIFTEKEFQAFLRAREDRRADAKKAYHEARKVHDLRDEPRSSETRPAKRSFSTVRA